MRLFAALLLLLLMPSCKSTGGSAPVVGFARLDASWVLWDGQVFVGTGNAAGQASVLGKVTGLPLVGPVDWAADKVVVLRREPAESLELEVGDPLPSWAATVFPPGLAESLGVTFED